MNWTTGAPASKPLSIETQQVLGTYGGQQQVLQAWQAKATELETLKVQEMALRKAAVELYFPHPVEGVNRTELGNGWNLKADIKYNYKLNNKAGEYNAEKALDDITSISQKAGFVAERLIKWNPDLSIKEYRELNPDMPEAQTDEQKKILGVLQKVLTITPGSPALDIEPPKKK